MTQRIFRLEFVLYCVAFVGALIFRLASIGQSPLSDREAELALQALALSKGQYPLLASHPIYLALTTAWMFLFGASAWTARFWPAMAGSVLVVLPIFYRRYLGQTAAVLLAFFLAFGANFLAMSITAGSPVFAVLFLFLSIAMLLEGRSMLAGLFTGMALLSGTAIWLGLLGLLAACLILIGLRWIDLPAERGGLFFSIQPINWKRLLLAGLVTLLLAGTLFAFIPQGLSAFGSSLASFFSGWTTASLFPAELLVMGYLVYGFLLVFLGLWGAIRGLLQREKTDRVLAVWSLLAFILGLAYPDRQMANVIWSLVPVAALAARQAARFIAVHPSARLSTLGQAALAGLIMGYLALTLFAMVNNPQYINESEYWLRLAGAFVMLAASAGLIAWGWSREVSLRGLVWGFLLILSLLALSSAWNVSSLSSRAGNEFWNGEQVNSNDRLFLETIDQLSQWATQKSGGLDMVVVGNFSPAVRWMVRDIENIKFVAQLAPTANPSIVITPEQPDLALASAYRGQSFLLQTDTDWRFLQPQEWLRWLVFRTIPEGAQLKERIILWARTDLFPGDEQVVSP